jgi:SIR2-like domain
MGLLEEEALDEHYEHVAEALSWGAVIPLLGAGVNVCDPAREAWVPGENLPSGRELSRHLAQRYRYPGKDLDDLARVSQYAQAKRGDGTLYDQLHGVFTATYGYTAVHRFLAELPRRMQEQGVGRRHQLIVTTNYDDAMEQALTDAGEEFDLVWYSATGRRSGIAGKFLHKPPGGEPTVIERPNEYRLSVQDRTVILKIHGAASRTDRQDDSYVITEDHYIEFLTHTTLHELIPKTLLATLLNGHFLFLGYSLRDWNLRVILHQIWMQREQSRDSWAIQHEVQDIDRVLWEDRDVLLHEVALDRYVQELAERVAGQASGRAAS